MDARRHEKSGFVIVFPERACRRVGPTIPDRVAAVSARRRPCTVVPLRSGHAAKRAAVLVKVRCLNAEIRALKSAGLRQHP